MKVLCILVLEYWIQSPESPVKNEIYTVIDKVHCDCGCNRDGYKLLEVNSGDKYFEADCFVPIEPTEEEISEFEKQQTEQIQEPQKITI